MTVIAEDSEDGIQLTASMSRFTRARCYSGCCEVTGRVGAPRVFSERYRPRPESNKAVMEFPRMLALHSRPASCISFTPSSVRWYQAREMETLNGFPWIAD